MRPADQATTFRLGLAAPPRASPRHQVASGVRREPFRRHGQCRRRAEQISSTSTLRFGKLRAVTRQNRALLSPMHNRHLSICTATTMPRLTIAQKILLCDEARQGLTSPTSLGKWPEKAFKLPRPLHESTVRSILSRADRLRALPDSYQHLHNLRRQTMLEYDAQLMELMKDFEDDDTLPPRSRSSLPSTSPICSLSHTKTAPSPPMAGCKSFNTEMASRSAACTVRPHLWTSWPPMLAETG